MNEELLEQSLLKDKEVAKVVGFSPEWVRQQRMKRRRGEGHTFTLDPILIADSPRYRMKDVLEWLKSLQPESMS